jgi:hypothetical protein
MKSVFSIVLMLLIFIQISIKPITYFNWKINQELITQKYCVNKDKPMLHCDGKCYLMKKMNQLDLEEKQERQKFPYPSQKLKQVETPFLAVENNFAFFDNEFESAETAYPFSSISDLYNFDFYKNCFQPPRIV